MKTSFVQIKRDVTDETIIEKSRFICSLAKVTDEDSAREFVNSVKREHPFATHNCYAYVVDDRARFSDDGEPQGTAGQPMLEVLKNKGLSNVVAVVTRYFGGIKLGAGGLVRAYSGSVSAACNAAGTQTLYLSDVLDVSLTYDAYKPFERLCRNLAINVLSTDFNSSITVRIAAKLPSENTISKIVDALCGKIDVKKIDEGFYAYGDENE